MGRRRERMADLWWKEENIRKRERITAEVDFWWREVEELQPSRSLQETTQPFTYLKTLKMISKYCCHYCTQKKIRKSKQFKEIWKSGGQKHCQKL